MRNHKSVISILLAIMVVFTFMPTMSFAAEAEEGHHSLTGYGQFAGFDSTALDAEGLEVLVEPTCTTDGVGVVACDQDLNDEKCGFTKTVWIDATGHTAGEMKRIGSVELMKHIGYTSENIDYFFSRNNGAYSYCECYVYVCKDCGEFVDEQGRKVNAMWTSGNPVQPVGGAVCPVSADRVKDHTKPADTPNCQALYTCEVCGYDKCKNDEYKPGYHNPNTETPADKDLTVTQENVHAIGENKYVKVVKWTCNLCGEEGREANELVGYSNWNEVTHPNVTRVVTKEPTCTAAGEFAMRCDDCGRDISTGTIQKLKHEFETGVAYVYKAGDKYDDGSVIDPTDFDFNRYTYVADVCKNCRTVKKGSIEKTEFAPIPADSEISFAEFTKANCEQGSWIKVSIKNGELIRAYYSSDEQVEQLINNGSIVKVGDKYYTNAPGTAFDKIEVPYTPALKHDFGDVVQVAEPTCTEKALEAKVCEKCGKVDHNTVHAVGEALGHDVTTVKVNPTCGAIGYTYDTCSRCKEIVLPSDAKDTDYVYIEAAKAEGSVYNVVDPLKSLGAECSYEWKVLKEATEDEDGSQALVCSVCGTQKAGSEMVIPAKGKSEEEKEAEKAAEKAAAVEAAKPAVEAASNVIDNAKEYTEASVKAVEEAKANLNQAIASGTTADVKAMTEALQTATNNAQLKAENTMVAKGKTVKAKAKKNTTFKKSKAFTVKNAQGKVTFKKVKGNKKVVVKSNGKVVVKKGLKKGKTYNVKVAVKAAGDGNTKALTKTVTLKVKVK